MNHILLLVLAALFAGAMNAIAGGGSFVTFPALVFTGVPSVAANATSTVAMFPGYFSSAWAYRHDLKPVPGVGYRILLGISLAGGAVGAVLLLVTPVRAFDAIVPWLLLGATALFAIGKPAGAWLRQRITIGPAALVSIQFAVSIYGGYFGGAVGIMMLAALGLLGLSDVNQMNATKSLLAGTMNTIAVVIFIAAGKIFWTQALVMLVAGVIGAYAGARVARRIPGPAQRVIVTLIGTAMSVAFFLRTV